MRAHGVRQVRVVPVAKEARDATNLKVSLARVKRNLGDHIRSYLVGIVGVRVVQPRSGSHLAKKEVCRSIRGAELVLRIFQRERNRNLGSECLLKAETRLTQPRETHMRIVIERKRNLLLTRVGRLLVFRHQGPHLAGGKLEPAHHNLSPGLPYTERIAVRLQVVAAAAGGKEVAFNIAVQCAERHLPGHHRGKPRLPSRRYNSLSCAVSAPG